jgi:hypothetical protein
MGPLGVMDLEKVADFAVDRFGRKVLDLSDRVGQHRADGTVKVGDLFFGQAIA